MSVKPFSRPVRSPFVLQFSQSSSLEAHQSLALPSSQVVGIIAGPYVTGGFDPRSWGGAHHDVTNEITLEVTRVVIAISVFAVGVGQSALFSKVVENSFLI